MCNVDRKCSFIYILSHTVNRQAALLYMMCRALMLQQLKLKQAKVHLVNVLFDSIDEQLITVRRLYVMQVTARAVTACWI